ncbi:MAG TPA: LysR family transcriptional regulator [Kofleriaceae bacterium]|nr:LysR family transcriptional regulator [Kofleriaceae bacterium]
MSRSASHDKKSLPHEASLDWNLLPGLHALLEEASVSRAAARLGVTVPSMSRMLGRLRTTLGDPLLVRAGRALVPTAYASGLRERVAQIAADGHALLTGGGEASLAGVERRLVIRSNDGMVGPWLAPLIAAVHARAPRLRLVFVSEGDERADDLRDGRVDLDLGVVGDAAPELRTQVLVRDRFVAVVRRGHPVLRRRRRARFVAFPHLGISRRGQLRGPIDRALHAAGLARDVVATVPTASAAAIAAASTDWITAMPGVVATPLARVLPIATFAIPLALPEIVISQTWHPRFDRDPAHRLLRDCLWQLARGA